MSRLESLVAVVRAVLDRNAGTAFIFCLGVGGISMMFGLLEIGGASITLGALLVAYSEYTSERGM